MKKHKIIFWAATGFIFLFEGVMPALTGHSELAIQGVTHLGYPLYFVTILVVFKIIGVLVLIIPQLPNQIKEWAYAGFAINFICASISTYIVDGGSSAGWFPLVIFAILIASYISYHKLLSINKAIA
jgi:hypothetical protein